MGQFIICDLNRVPVVVALVGRKKPGLLQFWYRTSERTGNVIEVEVRRRIGIQGALGVLYTLLVLNCETRQSRVFVVVKNRAMKLVCSALGCHADAGNAGILGT